MYFAEHVTDLADRPVLVVGQRLNQERHAARTVAFVGDLFVRDTRLFARAAANGALDVLARHVVRLGLGDDGPQPRVHVGIAAAAASGDGQFLDEAREDLAALGVGGTLLVLDCVPLGMARHAARTPRKYGETGPGILPCDWGRRPGSTRCLSHGRGVRARITQTSARGSHGPPR